MNTMIKCCIVLFCFILVALPGYGQYTSEFKILPDDGAEDDSFGTAVAIDGVFAIVGAEGDRHSSHKAGVAYIFQRNTAGDWIQIKTLTAGDTEDRIYFGESVSICSDFVIVGASGDEPNGTSSGSAYIFARNQGGEDNWGQVKKLIPDDGAANDYFGYSVSISGDYAIVGAYWDDDHGNNSGSSYIFARNQGGADNWGQTKKLTAGDGAADDCFGHSVAIHGDHAAAGATYDDDNGNSSGSAYLFYRNQGGADNWGQLKKMTAGDGAANDYFGYSVSISGDFSLIGAINNNESGSAYIFARNQGGTDNWGLFKKLAADDGLAGDQFGKSVFISGDKTIVGALSDDYGYNSGSAYIFSRNQGGPDNWGQVTKLIASDAAFDDAFGTAVSMSGDFALVGAYGDDDNGSTSGSAYIFASEPEMDVRGNGVSIADGDDTPSTSDGTDFGSAGIGNPTQPYRTFTIINNGLSTLNLNGSPQVQISGTNAADFIVNAEPSSSVAPSGSTTFTLCFAPNAVGLRTAIVSITNDDADENPYDFVIQGTGTGAPEMDVKGNNISIVNGDNTPSTSDGTDFGAAEIGGDAVYHSFFIFNRGNISLYLTGSPHVQISGPNMDAFSFIPLSANSEVTIWDQWSFGILFSPRAPGLHTATITIPNDDPDENPYEFAIQGTGVSPSDWTDVSPAPSPADRYWHGLAYIGNGRILMFGGTNGSTNYNDTWLYDITNNTWTNKQPANAPGGRFRMAMTYIGDGKVLMYGGSPVIKWIGYNPAIETWLYDLASNSWTKLTPGGTPPALDGQGMSYIGGTDKVMMFGGRVVNKFYSRSDQTWIFDLSQNKWTRKSANKARPSGRTSFGMAYFGGDQAVLFGGYTGTTQDDETWLYDRSDDTWTLLSPSVCPPARYNHAAACLGGDRILIFGGRADIIPDPNSNSETVLYGDTWVFDKSDNTWTEDDNNDTSPAVRANPGLAETSLDGSSRIVLFGGNTDVDVFGDTWTFGGADYLAKRNELAEDDTDDDEEQAEREKAIPTEFVLQQNYPNPFNPTTEICYSLPFDAVVSLKVYDARGREVAVLVETSQPAGQYRMSFDGRLLTSGVYLCRLTATNLSGTLFTDTRRMILLK
ncbi:choice-of-anchor D domain-containing protein [candidate division KSB1 bacterium]|nr:choice-of-anchor D domain-containing protein [candidate division KSB1 bacterium]